MSRLILKITGNPVSLFGTGLVTVSALVFLAIFALGLIGLETSVYVGILAYVALPGVFVVGLALIPLGLARQRRRERRAAAAGVPIARSFPVVDLNQPGTQRTVLVVAGLTFVNLLILSVATYKGIEVMDSTAFCGTTCHTVMEPEYTAYQRSPHARVACVDCHIGPGADWFAKSKLSGAWQLVATSLDLYPRPIPTPIANLRPARETCEQCHWPTKFVGDRLRVITHYDEDRENTELKTVLLLRVGGIYGRESMGIHWHVDPANRIRYRSDDKRETIGEVELTIGDERRVYLAGGGESTPADAPGWRVMDCIDCHNRPTHIYDTPARAVDRAMATGRLARALPHLRREGVAAISVAYPSGEEAARGILAALTRFYAGELGEAAAEKAGEIAAAAATLTELWAGNVFPKMRVTWGTYPNHIGHQESPGCFRCHDDGHDTADGRTISQDCDTCHTLLAEGEKTPLILEQLKP